MSISPRRKLHGATGDCKHFLPCYAVICSGIVQSHLKLNTVKQLFCDVYSPRRKLHGATGLHVLNLRKGGLLIGTKTPEAPKASNLDLNFFSFYPKFHTFFPPINDPKLYLLFPYKNNCIRVSGMISLCFVNQSACQNLWWLVCSDQNVQSQLAASKDQGLLSLCQDISST